MRTFDYSFLSNVVVNSNILQTTNIVHSLRADAKNRKLAHKAIFDRLVSVAKARSVMASNAIEGIVSTDKHITEIVNNHSEPLNHDEKELLDLLPDVSVSTIERVLAQMLKEGKIQKLGSFKNARYKRKLKT
ncbi:MAG: hypothetical protein GX816_02615 [Erysipelotrichia bacterium]|jgi:hypothetical protein|nr:hypothetical protein [Erysipelotrichia bacterium]